MADEADEDGESELEDSEMETGSSAEEDDSSSAGECQVGNSISSSLIP